MKIKIDDAEIMLDVEYGKRKKISVHLDDLARIKVKAPKGTSEEVIANLIRHNFKLISDKREQLLEALKPREARKHSGEGSFLLLGKEDHIGAIIQTEGLGEEEQKASLKKFYIKESKRIIDERVKLYKKQLSVNPKSVEIMDSRTKWGSCDSTRKLKFNYALAMVPLELIDYVVVHELCHIIHMNHDRSFWRLVGSIVPDYKRKIEQLNRYTQHTMEE
ncbi:hypothetical protein EAL2_808p00120 (plasmid) [Peptoclostridium acidaminophilum DSM 3953]|uniref:YgjP-like metallopeptidase domain-containing protein n=1 Tax=Peptoclostridium acidaminophilum DSM 3953 TaxID=1286171 RepID=W8T6Z7_PEPAC|nr:SprT family zinc-dependent metalloprotease [Peptoclostridium acidaminophilum]AHM57519.1 hypothetical protein EAL2_808p00120 [Peptoclostridium acidaminophilum DSM 3953]